MDTKINDNGVEVRQDRNEKKNAKGDYYHCRKCGYNNTDIKDVSEEVCFNCGSENLVLKTFI
jgi:rubrerythrin